MQPEINGELDGEAFTWGKPWGPGRRRAARCAGPSALRNRWLRDADAFVAMSRLIREEMLAAGVPAERVALLPHGVDTERVPARRARGARGPARAARPPVGRRGGLHGPAAARQGARAAARGLLGAGAGVRRRAAASCWWAGEGQVALGRGRAAAARRRARRWPGASCSRAAVDAWSRIGCGRRTCSCSPRCSRRSASRWSRPRPAACRRSAAAPAGSWT